MVLYIPQCVQTDSRPTRLAKWRAVRSMVCYVMCIRCFVEHIHMLIAPPGALLTTSEYLTVLRKHVGLKLFAFTWAHCRVGVTLGTRLAILRSRERTASSREKHIAGDLIAYFNVVYHTQ